MRRYLVVIMLCGMLLSSCGIFAPDDDFEAPKSDVVNIDPFNFRALLEGTGEEFSDPDWSQFFDDSLTYVNVRLENERFGKASLTAHLNRQLDISRGFTVTWVKSETRIDPSSIVLNEVEYMVEVPGSAEPAHTGNCIFEIRRDQGGDWHVLRWIDDPATASFFSPVRSSQ